MTTAIQTSKPAGAVTLRDLVSQPAYQSRFKEVLGDKAQQFCTSLINVGNTMLDVEPHSVIQSAMIAAALDLPIDKNLGFSWIVPFKKGGVKFAQFQMGFKGYIQLGLRSKQYQRMNARAINEEAFGGFDEVGEPIIDWSKVDEAKPVTGYVFAFKLTNGYVKVAYWTKKRVEAHATRYSQSFKGGFESPWKTHFDEMALKTVIKNELSRWGIMSIQMHEAIQKDQAVIDVDGKVSFPDHSPAALAPSFDPPPALLGTPTQSDDGDLGPEPATTEVKVKVEPAPTMKPTIREEIEQASVTFDDFRDFLVTHNIAARDVADSWGSYEDVPAAKFEVMSPKQKKSLILTFGQAK